MSTPSGDISTLGLLINLSRIDVIRLALANKGHSFTSIAQDLGVSRPAVSGALNGQWSSKRILSHVAALLGVPVESLQGRPLTPVSVAGEGRRVNDGLSESSRHQPPVRRRRAA